MPVSATLKENFLTPGSPFEVLIVAHYHDSVTLYCTLSHFSTPFGMRGPAVSTASAPWEIYFTQFHTIDLDTTLNARRNPL
jgi:hypothetical protein